MDTCNSFAHDRDCITDANLFLNGQRHNVEVKLNWHGRQWVVGPRCQTVCTPKLSHAELSSGGDVNKVTERNSSS